MSNALSVTATPTSTELASIGDNLARFNDGDVGPSERLALAVLLRDETGELVGGLSGYTAWGWLYVQWLWLAEDQRGGGWAGRMLAAAEEEARQRGCHGAHIDTFNPVALKVYERQGYAVFGQLPDFPKGQTRSFLMKVL
ncbi:GNAT family N-acetyltransferase [Devosia sp. A449]